MTSSDPSRRTRLHVEDSRRRRPPGLPDPRLAAVERSWSAQAGPLRDAGHRVVERTHRAIAGSALVVLRDAPHGCNVSHADAFDKALPGFLGGQAGGGPVETAPAESSYP